MTRPTDQTDEDEFEPASGWNRSSLDVASHETAHAQVADFLGVEIKEVRIDNPVNRFTRGPDPRGRCITEKINNGRHWKHLCISLAPMIVEGRAPQSPPSLSTAEYGDEMNIAQLCYELEIDAEKYDTFLHTTIAILEHPIVKKKGNALSRALLDHGALKGDEVRRIFGEVMEAQGKGKAAASDLDEDQRPRVVTALPHAGGN